jgi:hypothetical protein
LGAKTTTVASRKFYLWMATACLGIAILGFMPTYFVPMAQSKFKAEPVVHIHGLILFSWVLFFFVQAWLVARGRILAHRTWGVLGIAIVTAMSFIIITLVSLRIAQASLPGQPAGLDYQVRAFEYVNVIEVAFVVTVFILAIVNIRRPEIHKRLLLLMTVSLLGAPIARWFAVLLAPPPGAVPPPVPGLPQIAAPPVFVVVPPALCADLLIVVAIIYDWRTRGRPHPAYLIGGGILLAIQLSAVPISASATWQSIAAVLGHLAG